MNNKPKSGRNLAKNVETRPQPRQQADNKTALQFLDSIISLSPVNRQTHVQAQQALQQIDGALKRLDAFMLADKMDKEDEERP